MQKTASFKYKGAPEEKEERKKQPVREAAPRSPAEKRECKENQSGQEDRGKKDKLRLLPDEGL